MERDVERPQWRKSSYSGGNGGGWVEVTRNLTGIVAVRGSKDPDGPRLAVAAEEVAAFLSRIKAGELNLA